MYYNLLDMTLHHYTPGGDPRSLTLDQNGDGSHDWISGVLEVLGVEGAGALVRELVAPELHGEGSAHARGFTIMMGLVRNLTMGEPQTK